MDFTLFAYEISPSCNPPCIYFERTLEACRQTALEQRHELLGDEDTGETLGLITIFECRMRMPTQEEIMAALNASDDPNFLRNATMLEKTVVDYF
jgi:hypothetical protein